MEGKLYAIRVKYGKPEVIEVDVESKTDKQYKLCDDRICRRIVNTGDLYYELYNYMFGTNKDKLIDSWNERRKKEIDRLVSKLKSERNLVIDKI